MKNGVGRDHAAGNSLITVIHHSHTQKLDLYQLLSISKNASMAQVKSAYHRTLLQSHPDKKKSSEPIDIALIKEAYSTLSNPQLRAEYDAQHSYPAAPSRPAPRPAQVVSLGDFEEVEAEESWRYTCRCGGSYLITSTSMDEGEHLIACNSCSEAIWVGYELVES